MGWATVFCRPMLTLLSHGLTSHVGVGKSNPDRMVGHNVHCEDECAHFTFDVVHITPFAVLRVIGLNQYVRWCSPGVFSSEMFVFVGTNAFDYILDRSEDSDDADKSSINHVCYDDLCWGHGEPSQRAKMVI